MRSSQDEFLVSLEREKEVEVRSSVMPRWFLMIKCMKKKKIG